MAGRVALVRLIPCLSAVITVVAPGLYATAPESSQSPAVKVSAVAVIFCGVLFVHDAAAENTLDCDSTSPIIPEAAELASVTPVITGVVIAGEVNVLSVNVCAPEVNAIVPLRLGTVKVLVVPVVMLDNSNTASLVVSLLS